MKRAVEQLSICQNIFSEEDLLDTMVSILVLILLSKTMDETDQLRQIRLQEP